MKQPHIVLKRVMYVLLLVCMFTNLWLSVYIESQKSALHDSTFDVGVGDSCFDGEGGCSTVQSSVYANAFVISNPILGVIAFSLFAFSFILLFVDTFSHSFRWLDDFVLYVHYFLIIGFFLGALFSGWLLYVQFFILYQVCIYCFIVDVIMIASLLLYLVFSKIVYGKIW